MLLNSQISAYATCFVGKVCGLVQSTWGTSRGEDTLGARARIRNTKGSAPGARRANIPPQMRPIAPKNVLWKWLATTVLVVMEDALQVEILRSGNGF